MSEIGNESLPIKVEEAFESPRLEEARKLVTEYESIGASDDELVNKHEIDRLFSDWLGIEGMDKSDDFIKINNLETPRVEEGSVSKVIDALEMKVMRSSTDKDIYGFDDYKVRETPDLMSDVSNVLKLRRFVEQSLTEGQIDSEKLGDLMRTLDAAEDMSRYRALLKITEEMVNKYKDDLWDRSGLRDFLPEGLEKKQAEERLSKEVSDSDFLKMQSGLDKSKSALEDLFVANDFKLCEPYKEVFSLVYGEAEDVRKSLENGSYQIDGISIGGDALLFRFNNSYDDRNDRESKIKRMELVDDFASGLSYLDKVIEVSMEESNILFDLISEECRGLLFDGAAESFEGSMVAYLLGEIRNSKAIPMMVEFLKERGGGHTGRVVVESLAKIIRDPISRESLDKLKSSLPKNDEAVVGWFEDENSPFSMIIRDDAHNGIYYFREMDTYLSRNALIQLVEKVAIAEGRETTNMSKRRFFDGGYGVLYDISIDSELRIFKDVLENDEYLDEISKVILDYPHIKWRTQEPKLFRKIVSPKDGDYKKFPMQVAKKMEITNENMLAKLSDLYELKDLSKRGISREMFADGLLMLVSRENGREVMEKLLSLSTGAKDDAPRIRRIFRSMKALDSMGSHEFPTQSESLVEALDLLRDEVAEQIMKAMGLNEDDKSYIKESFEEMTEKGFYEIIPTLMSKYEQTNHKQALDLTRIIASKLLREEFGSWRNSNENALEVLNILSDDKKEVWLSSGEKVELSIKSQSEQEKRDSLAESIRGIVSEAKNHAVEDEVWDFSQKKIDELKAQESELIEKLKSVQDLQAKRELGLKKRGVTTELNVIEGIMKLSQISADDISDMKFLNLVGKTQSAMAGFENLEQSSSDLAQISTLISSQEKLAEIDSFVAYDTDDPFMLLNIGVEPKGSCQSWNGGSHNYCLPSYVADVNKRLVRVEDKDGEVVARSLIKLVELKSDDGNYEPAMLVEPVYTTVNVPEVSTSIVRFVMKKAKLMNVPIIMTRNITVQTGPDNSKSVDVVKKEAERLGVEYEDDVLVSIRLPSSLNSHEYSDSLGGDIDYFGYDKKADEATVVYPNILK